MKQEYHFTISRTDRICLIVFVFLLLGWEMIKYAIPRSVHEKEWLSQHNKILANQINTQDTQTVEQKKFRESFQTSANSVHTTTEEEMAIAEPAPVSVNAASREELIAIGFSSKVAYNIQKYIASGGQLKNEKDVMKIYGMDSTQWRAVSPYLIFPEEKKPQEKIQWTQDKKEFATVPIDLNTAVATDFEMLPGIGTVLAERIIKYRTSLGGYIDIAQLKECYGLPPETFDKIEPRLMIELPPTLIDINNIDMSNFSHPYLSKKMLGILKAYKKQHGSIMNEGDLRKIYPPDTTWYERLLPYISYN